MKGKTGYEFHGCPYYVSPGIHGIYVKNYINLYYTVTFYRIGTYKEH